MYFVPCTESGDGKRELLLLPTKYGAVVFAFTDMDTVLPPFLELLSMVVKDGYRLVVRRENAQDDKELLQRISAEIDQTQLFVLAIEGTAQFQRLINELADRTIWPNR